MSQIMGSARSQIDSLLIPFCGAFSGTPAEGLKETVLLKSTKESQLVDKMMAELSGAQIAKEFTPSGKEQALAIRPFRPDLHELLARTYSQLGDPKRAQEHQELARRDLQVEVGDHLHAAVALADPVQLDSCHAVPRRDALII